jgi:hypothetical protein
MFLIQLRNSEGTASRLSTDKFSLLVSNEAHAVSQRARQK